MKNRIIYISIATICLIVLPCCYHTHRNNHIDNANETPKYSFKLDHIETNETGEVTGVFKFINFRLKPIIIRSFDVPNRGKIELNIANGSAQENGIWKTVDQPLPTIDLSYKDLSEVDLKFGRRYKLMVPLDIYIERYKNTNLKITIGPIESKPFTIAGAKQTVTSKNNEMIIPLKRIGAREQYTSSSHSILTMMCTILAFDPGQYHLVSKELNNPEERHLGYEIKNNKITVNYLANTDINNGFSLRLKFNTKYFNAYLFKQKVAKVKPETSLIQFKDNNISSEWNSKSQSLDDNINILLFSNNYDSWNEKRLNLSLYDITHEEEYFTAQLICATKSNSFTDEDASRLFINILNNITNCFN